MKTMPVDFSWTANDTKLVLPIMLTLLGFVIYWFFAQSPRIRKSFYAKYDEDRASEKHYLFGKFSGFAWMAVFPLIFMLIFLPEYSLKDYGLWIEMKTLPLSLAYLGGICALVIPLAYISAKKPRNLMNYPQIRAKEWDRRRMVMSGLGWFAYLFAYEFLFRGMLLIPTVEVLGIWPAIAINLALYSGTHIPKGLDETLGAIPMGIVLCIVTLQTGSLFAPVIGHVALAWTNNFTALKYHPEMRVIKRSNG